MKKTIVLYNPLSNNKKGKELAPNIENILSGEFVYEDITKTDDIAAYVNSVDKDTAIVLSGGDGTINHFINAFNNDVPEHEILYYATGSGNDFMTDIKKENDDSLPVLNKYIRNLPTVTVNGETYKFINGIGYGIDGYCCEVGDKQRLESDKPVNYAGIAIKGLLFHFKPRKATVTVDGVTKTFKGAWLAPTMKGRFYGGGMMVAPAQNRLLEENTVSTVVMYGSGKLKTLLVFPSIFKGEHIKHSEMVSVMTGKEITVRFDKPCALQIDGETVLNVSEYVVKA